MEYRDYYATLGVGRDASQAEIRKAFRKLARKHHPDVNKGDAQAEQRFKEISEAHEVLSDPEKRRHYDRLGADWEALERSGAGAAGSAGGPFAGFGTQGGHPGGVRFEFHGNPEDLAGFSDFFRTFFAGAMPGAGGRTAPGGRSGGIDLDSLLRDLEVDGTPDGTTSSGRRAARRAGGRDVAAQAEISLEEVATGTRRIVGVGGRRLEVAIPAGVEDGQRIRLSGTGEAGGNVYLTVRVRPHPVFTRSGADVSRELPITLEEALLGARVPVATLAGRTLLLTIPAGTQNGRLFRLSGQGLPRFRGDGRGDLLVRARVVLPAVLDEEGRSLARALADHVKQPDPRSGASRDARQPLETTP